LNLGELLGNSYTTDNMRFCPPGDPQTENVQRCGVVALVLALYWKFIHWGLWNPCKMVVGVASDFGCRLISKIVDVPGEHV
jgi:hypothetical protein